MPNIFDKLQKLPIIGKFFEPDNGGEPPQPIKNDADENLYKRLFKESKDANNRYYIQRINSISLELDSLIDKIVLLMFDLRIEKKGFEPDWSENSLLDILKYKESESKENGKKYILDARWKTFYIYFYRDSNLTIDGEQISRTFYEKLFSWSKEVVALKSFMEKYINELNFVNSQAEITFDPDNETHQNLFKNAFICNFSLCRKSFSKEDIYFIVGCNPLYDTHRIKFESAKRRSRQSMAQSNDDESSDIKVAFRYYYEYSGNDNKHIQFNAHRFEADDESPQPETSLFVGNWKKNWTVTAGTAEHDEIYCPDSEENSKKLHLDNLKSTISGYSYNHYPGSFEGLPKWMDGIKWASHTPINISLLSVINPHRFKTQFVLNARIFPAENDGQLDEIENNQALKNICSRVGPISALKISDNFWLIRGRDLKLYRFTRAAGGWIQNEVDNDDLFEFEGCDYIWRSDAASTLPASLNGLGILYIYPSERKRRSYELQLSLDPKAEFVIANNERSLNENFRHDSLLGRQGTLKLKCKREIDGRGEFVFLPVTVSENTYFAIRPVGGAEESWQSKDGWIEHPEKENNKATIDKNGILLYDGKEVIAKRYSYYLICGTSLFQLKVSGTPRVQKVSLKEDDVLAESVTVTPTTIKQIALPPASTPDQQNVVALLQNTKWATYQPVKKSDSNISVHFDLNKGEESLFLKAFFPECDENAGREEMFYKRYRERAAELFIQPPEFLYRDEDENSLWGMIFPKLRQKERVFPALAQASLPQTVAVGYVLSLLNKTLSDDRLINYDIDPSILCFKNDGRICIVDFDNVFPLVDYPPTPEQLSQVGSLSNADELPIKTLIKPPEAQRFNSSDNKLEALAEITPAYGVFMIGMTLLEMCQALANENGKISVKKGSLVENAADEEKAVALEFEDLLQNIIFEEVSARISSDELLEKLKQIIRQLSEYQTARQQMAVLLGEETLDEVLKQN